MGAIRINKIRSLVSIAVAGILILSISYLGVRTYQDSHASSAGAITLTPASGTYANGSTVSVTVNENSGTSEVNSVQVSLTYDPSKLQYVSLTEGGAFPHISATETSTPGVVRVARYAVDETLSGIKPIVTANFKVIAITGTADIGIDREYSFLADATTNDDLLQTVGSASFTISNASTATKPVVSIAPATGSFAAGSTVAATIRLNAYANRITTVQTAISYPSNLLQYVSVSEGTAFTTKQRTTATGGIVDIIRAIPGGGAGVTGDNVVVTINFKVLAAGSATLGIAGASAAYDNSGTGTNILDKTNSRGAVYTLGTAATTPSVAPPATPPPATPPASSGNSSPLTSPSKAVTVGPTKTGSVSLSTAKDGSVLPKVGGQIDLGPVVDPGATGIKKVEYYLNDKLVSTQTAAPFTYQLDTEARRNGKYILRVKTSYASGVVDTRTENLLISNKVNFGYVVRHYGLSAAGTAGLMAVIGFFLWKLVIPRFGHGSLHGGYAADIDIHGPGDHPVFEPVTIQPDAVTTPDTVIAPDTGRVTGEPTIVQPASDPKDRFNVG